jgi:ATP-dependent helicase HrpB
MPGTKNGFILLTVFQAQTCNHAKEPTIATFPIDQAIADIKQGLRGSAVLVLQAPPGAGKTTRLPPALLDEPWLHRKRIVLIEPRRIVVTSIARYLAAQLDETVGQTIGYRIRFDSRVSVQTRLEVVTPGLFIRILQKDPELNDVGLVIFDEFHERSLDNDLALALSREAQSLFREDLRLLIMSATLDTESICSLLPVKGAPAPMVTVAGRSFPVTTHYLRRESSVYLSVQIVEAIKRALVEESGSILVFLPGQADIHRLHNTLSSAALGEDVLLLPLYGDLSLEQQQAAIRPVAPGKRKIVMATSIAETSLTIPDIRVVVDSGQTRVPLFDPVSGMSRLQTVWVSQASADQRRGRAGRTESGVCYRLWTTSRQQGLAPHSTPEILQADLVPLTLELANWGVSAADLVWMNPPKAASLATAQELLASLNAVDAGGAITESGRRLAEYPVHPRLAHMIETAGRWGLSQLACELAALLSERDILRNETQSDMMLRLWALEKDGAQGAQGLHGEVDRHLRQRILQVVRQLQTLTKTHVKAVSILDQQDSVGILLALAYPDRIAQSRHPGSNRYLLSNGKGAWLEDSDPLVGSDYLVAPELDGKAREARIQLAARVSRSVLEACFSENLVKLDRLDWDEAKEAVIARRELKLGELVLRSEALQDLPADALARGLCAGIRRKGIDVLPWTDDLRRLQQRICFVRRSLDSTFPDLSDARLCESLELWLLPYLPGMSRFSHLHKLDLRSALLSLLDRDRQQQLDSWAPSCWQAPTGTRPRIEYPAEGTPFSEVRLQEVLGQSDTPRIGNNTAILLHLLSPARRPVAVTDNLKRFWEVGYPEVRKELRGRYPRHPWPENPLQAAPTNRVKPRGT